MAQSIDQSEQGVNKASLISPVPAGTHGQRNACHVDTGSNEPAAAADSGSSGGADAPRADAPEPGPGRERSGWRGGRPPLDANERRTHTVSTRFNKNELHELDLLSTSVGLRRGEYLRLACFRELPPTIPELNKTAWLELSKAAANLNQIAYQLNKKGDDSGVDIEEISNMLSYFRQILIEVGEAYESES